MRITGSISTLGCLAALTLPSSAQCGSWTSGFEGADLSDNVNALAVFDDGSGPALYAAGRFRFAGATRVDRIARWNGTSWSALSAGGIDGEVFALCVSADPALATVVITR